MSSVSNPAFTMGVAAEEEAKFARDRLQEKVPRIAQTRVQERQCDHSQVSNHTDDVNESKHDKQEALQLWDTLSQRRRVCVTSILVSIDAVWEL